MCAALSLDRHQNTIDFDPGDVCGGPLFAPPSNSARVQSRVEFVELGGNMYSNYQGEGAAGTGITGWYQLVTLARTTHYIRTSMYVQVPSSAVPYVSRMDI